MDIAIIKNTLREGPGLFEFELSNHGLSYQVFDLDAGDPLPEYGSFRGLVVLGGPDSANDQTNKIISELELIQRVLRSGIPYVGICLGLQLMVKALGGKVVASSYKEIGFRGPDKDFYRVHLTDEGKRFPLLRNIPEEFPVLQLHGEMVEFNQHCTLLGTGRWCIPQIVGYGSHAIGFQGHLEVDTGFFESLIKEDEDLRQLDQNMLRSDYNQIKTSYLQVGRNLITNFINAIP
jgi:GMP synthase-like glutamine amidotransferase